MFIARDTGAQAYFNVPLVRAQKLYSEAIRSTSGLCRTARGPSMSCTPGKVEVVGVQEVQGTEAFVLRFLQCSPASASARKRARDHPLHQKMETSRDDRGDARDRRDAQVPRRRVDRESIFREIRPEGADSASFLSFSELQLCENGVFVVSRHRGAVFMIIRASVRRASEPRQFRDCAPRRRSGTTIWSRCRACRYRGKRRACRDRASTSPARSSGWTSSSSRCTRWRWSDSGVSVTFPTPSLP